MVYDYMTLTFVKNFRIKFLVAWFWPLQQPQKIDHDDMTLALKKRTLASIINPRKCFLMTWLWLLLTSEIGSMTWLWVLSTSETGSRWHNFYPCQWTQNDSWGYDFWPSSATSDGPWCPWLLSFVSNLQDCLSMAYFWPLSLITRRDFWYAYFGYCQSTQKLACNLGPLQPPLKMALNGTAMALVWQPGWKLSQKMAISGTNFSQHPLRKMSSEGTNFSRHPPQKMAFNGTNFSQHPSQKIALKGTNFSHHPLQKISFEGRNFTQHPPPKNSSRRHKFHPTSTPTKWPSTTHISSLIIHLGKMAQSHQLSRQTRIH